MEPRTRHRLYKIFTYALLWIFYTNLIIQFLKYNNDPFEARQINIAEDTYEVDQRASVCFKDVMPFSIPLIQGSEICQNKPDLLIMIHTEPDNFKMRNNFRNKFTNRIRNISSKYDFNVDIIYVIGLSGRFCIAATVLEEIISQKDILVGSFVDSYYNQTLKSITTLEWFVKNCKTASLLLKIDHRMDSERSLNTDVFYSLIRNTKQKEKIIIGSTNDVQITSHQRIPWILQPYLYPGLPQHLRLNYLLSRDSAENLLKAYADSIYITVWQEDLYVTGILASIARMKITYDENFLLECSEIVCLFCDCTSNDESQFNRLTMEKSTQLVTRNEIVRTIPKNDTETGYLITTTDPMIGTEGTSEWSMTDWTDATVTTAGTASTTTDRIEVTTSEMKAITSSLKVTTNQIENGTGGIQTTTTTVENRIENSSENTSPPELAYNFRTDLPLFQMNEYTLRLQTVIQDAEKQTLMNTSTGRVDDLPEIFSTPDIVHENNITINK